MTLTSLLARAVVLGTAGVYFSLCAPASAPAQTVLNAQQRWQKLCENSPGQAGSGAALGHARESHRHVDCRGQGRT